MFGTAYSDVGRLCDPDELPAPEALMKLQIAMVIMGTLVLCLYSTEILLKSINLLIPVEELVYKIWIMWIKREPKPKQVLNRPYVCPLDPVEGFLGLLWEDSALFVSQVGCVNHFQAASCVIHSKMSHEKSCLVIGSWRLFLNVGLNFSIYLGIRAN